jgi:signal transduction histidine kinase
MREEYKRRNYVINKRLQFGLIAAFLTAVLIASALAVVVMALAAEEFIDTFLVPVLLNDLAIMAAVIIVGIIFSNRIAGPLFHIRGVVEDVIAGKTDRRVRLRPKDFARDLAEKINTLLDKIEK